VTERLSCEKPVAQDANFILSSSKMSRVVIPNFSKFLIFQTRLSDFAAGFGQVFKSSGWVFCSQARVISLSSIANFTIASNS
jgi:hypothetical protein